MKKDFLALNQFTKAELDGIFRLTRLLKEKFPFIAEVRGIGLMIGMELSAPAGDIVNKALERGLLLNVAQDRVLRFVPPLVVTKAEVDEMIGILTGILAEM